MSLEHTQERLSNSMEAANLRRRHLDTLTDFLVVLLMGTTTIKTLDDAIEQSAPRRGQMPIASTSVQALARDLAETILNRE